MEPTQTTPTPEPVATTPNPTTPDAPANPGTGTGQATEPALRNQPPAGGEQPPATPAIPEGYVPNEKFTASQQEAIRLNDLVKSLGYDPKTGQKISGQEPSAPTTPQPTPTISYEQAVATVPGFSSLSDAEKALVLNPRQAYKDITDMRKMVAEMYDTQETAKQIKELTSKDEYKDLDKEAFKEFIYKDENLGVTNLETLAKMFRAEQATPAPATPAPEGAEPTTNGAKEIAPVNGITEISAADAAVMRQKEPKRYATLVREGKLKIV